jgi:hypothetical protein
MQDLRPAQTGHKRSSQIRAVAGNLDIDIVEIGCRNNDGLLCLDVEAFAERLR